jgi:protein-S-isoprenylcysteine O-methyltransferase Ste14
LTRTTHNIAFVLLGLTNTVFHLSVRCSAFCPSLPVEPDGNKLPLTELKFTMNNQISKSKGPGVFIPPPLFYVLIFIAAVFIQKIIPINDKLFHLLTIKVMGVILLIVALFFLVRSLRQFLLTKNTLILIKPASSLQTNGIYGMTRNPMYVGLAIVYLGITCFIGNWWNIILFQVLFIIVQEYIIKREEKYLQFEFGQGYSDYKRTVRRWL